MRREYGLFKNGMKRALLYRIVYIALFIIAVAAAVVLILNSNDGLGERTVVGCMLTGSRDEPGWNTDNYRGLAAACEDNYAELHVLENIPEEREACLKAIRTLVGDGCRMIFLTSYGYAEYAAEVAAEYPDVRFYANGSEYSADNMTYFFARMYQGRYLSGITAGLTTKTNVIGYVAAMPNNEVNRGINAFTLGVRSVNPDAAVRLIFTGSWDDPEKEEQSVEKLVSLSADVIAYHQNKETVPQTCERLGVDYIGYHVLSGEYSSHLLTSVSCRWRRLYSVVLRDDLSGRSAYIGEHWLGIDEMILIMSKPSENAGNGASEAMLEAKYRIEKGNDVFSGIIYDNTGELRCDEGEVIPDAELLTGMDWYAEGVGIIE